MALASTLLAPGARADTWTVGNYTNPVGATVTDPYYALVVPNVAVGTLTNSGTISSDRTGAYFALSTVSALHNENSGLITGITAIYADHSSLGTLSNNGTISGTLFGLVLYEGSIGTLSNSGTISGPAVAINNALGTIGILANSGTISTSTTIGNSMALLNSGSIGLFSNTGLVAGNIDSSSASALNISGASVGMGTLTGARGGIGAADIGRINSAAGVSFVGGHQLLNDNVVAGTVTNAAGSVLQINNGIAITGNYQQNAGGTLAIGVADGAVAGGTLSSDTGYGRLLVSGSANLASGSGILLKAVNSYAFAAGQRYVVIQAAASGTDYNAGTLNYSLSGQDVSRLTASGAQSTDSSYAYLLVSIADAVTGSTEIIRRATNRNAGAALNGLFGYTGSNQTLLDIFNPAAALGDAASANRAGAQLSPVATGSAAINGANAAFGAVQGATGARLDTLRTAQANGSGGVATGESTLSPALWGKLFGGHARQDERDGIAGYHANYGGLLIGSDAQVSPNWRAGGVVSYARVNVGNEGDNSGSSASVNGYGLTAYASYDGRPWYVNLAAGAARQQYSTDRLVSFTGVDGSNHGAFNGMVYSTTAQAGYPLAVGASTLTPLAALSYTSLRQGGYTETGSGSALTVSGSRSSSLKSELALKWERSMATAYGDLKPFVQLGWRHEFHATPLTTNAVFAADTTGTTAFTTQGASALRNTALLSLGASLLKTRDLSLAARYTLEAAAGYKAQAGELTLRWDY